MRRCPACVDLSRDGAIKCRCRVEDLHGWLKYAGSGTMPTSLEITNIGPNQVPQITFLLDDSASFESDAELVMDYFLDSPGDKTARPLFRCSSLERFECVKKSGIDVEPPTHTIYAANRLGKALEYSHSRSGVVCVYKASHLQPTWFKLTADNKNDLEAHLYPERCECGDATYRYRGRAVDVKCIYSKWVPGNPWDALEVVFVMPKARKTYI